MRGLGSLLKKGWRPLRTIVVASWDAEEYGLVGSTEFGEDYSEWLKDHVVSYHNLDVAVSGRKLAGKASPSLADLINGAAADVVDPDDSSKMLEINANHPLGSGSDYTVMLQYLGIASTDMGYKAGGASSPVYHYHSNYDSFAWMEKVSTGFDSSYPSSP